MKGKHIATGASWAKPPLPGMSCTRVGTRYLYTEAEIAQFLAACAQWGVAPYLRRRKGILASTVPKEKA
jgi:hypothetical protein